METKEEDHPALGRCLSLDQAVFGHPQHCHTTAWTNLADAAHLRRCATLLERAPRLCDLATALPRRVLPLAEQPLGAPFVSHNTPGLPVKTLFPGELTQL